jgi:hypothetical protein
MTASAVPSYGKFALANSPARVNAANVLGACPLRGTRRGMARQNVAVCSGFGHCEPIEVTRSSRKLPNCDNSGARKVALWPIGTIKNNERASAAAAEDLDIEIADFLAQRVAIDPEQIRRADLVTARGRERHRQERMLDLP